MQGWYLGRRIQGWLKLWLIGLVSLCLVVACQPSPPPSQDVTADCVTVSHSAGETCIPKTFERLVTLDSVSFEYAIAADLQPVGTTLSNFQTVACPPNRRGQYWSKRRTEFRGNSQA